MDGTLIEYPVPPFYSSWDAFSGFDILTYHGFSFPFYANTVPSLAVSNAMNTPNKIMSYLL